MYHSPHNTGGDVDNICVVILCKVMVEIFFFSCTVKCVFYLIFLKFVVFNIICGINIVNNTREKLNKPPGLLLDSPNNKKATSGSGANIDSFSNNDNNYIKRISEIRCKEFRNQLMKNISVIRLTNLEAIPLPPVCRPRINLLIANGKLAHLQEFPHMAAIGWKDDENVTYLCGGSLISNDWILTAAHCTHNHLGKPTIVKLGSSSLYDTLGKIIKIKKIIRHPHYKRPQFYFDIGLLQLAESVSFDDNIQPACLHAQFETTPRVVWATGWGSRQYDEKDFSEVLLKVRLNVVNNIKCSLAYNYSALIPHGITPSMMCAGDPYGEWKKDTCLGDSGGPIQVFDSDNCLYQIVGITSFGKLCMMTNTPGVYTRVSHYLDWIEPIVWP